MKGHSIRYSVLPSVGPSVPIQVVGIVCMELLLQFYSDIFETLNVFRSCSEDMHIVWI